MKRLNSLEQKLPNLMIGNQGFSIEDASKSPFIQNLMVKMNINIDQISSISRMGNDIVIFLVDGTQVVYESFFLQETLQTVSLTEPEIWNAIAEESNQPITDYLVSDAVPVNSLPIDSSIVPSALPTGSASPVMLAGQGALGTAVASSVPTWAWVVGGVAAVGGIAAAAGGGGGNDTNNSVPPDTTPPLAGVLGLSNLEDTGVSTTDRITQDKNFDLTLTGQEAGATVVYQVSTDGGKTWTATTANQKDLGDGSYQFKAIVTDAAGNKAETAVQQVVVDSKAPTVGVLALSNFEDTGVSATDGITKDNNFDLTLSGQEAGATVVYQVSRDDGKTWIDTTANQKYLLDGRYQYKAIVADAAGNNTETAVQKITVDTALILGDISLNNLEDTGASTTDGLTKDNSFDLTLSGHEKTASFFYQVSKDGGNTWAPTTANQKDLVDGTYLFRAVVIDLAGNKGETEVKKLVVYNKVPTAGVLALSNLEDTGASTTDRITKDNNFDLTLTGQEAGATVVYQVSTDGGKNWTITTANQKDLVDGSYQFKAIVTDAAGNKAETTVQQVVVDTKAPTAGVLALSNLEETAVLSVTDGITKDNNFDLTLTGQEAGTTVVYQVSTDGGKTWIITTTNQKDLGDGSYQFKAIVTDVAGNSASTEIQKITVENVPNAGTLSFSNLDDTGISNSDRVTQDRTFDLNIFGNDVGTTVSYQISKDGGKTWSATTTNQKDLVDGTYQFKALVQDIFGKIAETLVQSITIDNAPSISGSLILQNYEDAGLPHDFISKDNNFDLSIAGQEAGAQVSYQISKDVSEGWGGVPFGGTWTDTTMSQTNLVDGTYFFKAIVVDLAGNRSETSIQKVVVDTTAPVAGVLSVANYKDTGVSDTDFIGKDNNFDLTLTGQDSGTTVVYQVSTDGGKTWTTTTANQKELVDGSYQFKAIVTDIARNSADTAIQKITVDSSLSAGVLTFNNFDDTGSSKSDQITADRTFDLAIVRNDEGTTVSYQVSTDGGKTWSATTVNQKDLVDGQYQFKAIVQDAFGKTAETPVQSITIDNAPPLSGNLILQNYEDAGLPHDFISKDNNFDLSIVGQEVGAQVSYQISKDVSEGWGGGLSGGTWTDTTMSRIWAYGSSRF